jgi:hypothetical protein
MIWRLRADRYRILYRQLRTQTRYAYRTEEDVLGSTFTQPTSLSTPRQVRTLHSSCTCPLLTPTQAREFFGPIRCWTAECEKGAVGRVS